VAVLKDMHCTLCTAASEHMVDRDATEAWVDCPRCGHVALHTSRCTGGAKLKPYICSYDGRDWSGDIKHMGLEATYADGTPVRENAGEGERTDTAYRSDAQARIEAKRDRIQSEARRKAGGGALFVDQKTRPTPGR
jgi:hypothetical protein